MTRPKGWLVRVVGGVAAWLFSGYFVLFVANGGAAGSTEVSRFAWVCLAIYTLVFAAIFFARSRQRG